MGYVQLKIENSTRNLGLLSQPQQTSPCFLRSRRFGHPEAAGDMTMRLFLIRHGETVDNVAQVYAGLRDSALTTHGVLQAKRLASHIAKQISTASTVSIFTSTLQRAFKTAEAVRDAREKDDEVLRLPQLVEKDFGSGEGTKYGTGKGQPHEGSESAEAMAVRADVFLDDNLRTALGNTDAVVVVAHGIILNVLFKRLCEKLSKGSMTVSPDAQKASNPYPSGNIPVLPSWSNTGYLEAKLTMTEPASWSAVTMRIDRVNCVEHLQGLRKTRGGIGSAAFDEKQKTMASFFAPKKRKLADAVKEWYVTHARPYPSYLVMRKQFIHRPVLKILCGNNLSNRCLTEITPNTCLLVTLGNKR